MSNKSCRARTQAPPHPPQEGSNWPVMKVWRSERDAPLGLQLQPHKYLPKKSWLRHSTQYNCYAWTTIHWKCCLREWEYRVKETLPAASSFSQQRARLWLTVTDNASWTHHCHFKKNCPGTSSPHAKKRSTDDKHTANGWHVSRWKYIPLYRGVHRNNPLFIAIQICAQLAHTVFLVHGSFHTFRRISYSKLKRTKNTNLKIEEEQWNTIWQYDLINFPNLTAAEKKVCQQFPTMSFWEVE